MKLIKPSFEILTPIDGIQILKDIEIAGRTCYKSEDKITEDSAHKFVQMILGRAHESVIEHKSISVKFICDRGVSHEIVRHRLASFSQESTRYCNYSKDKFDNNLTFIIPEWLDIEEGEYKTHPDHPHTFFNDDTKKYLEPHLTTDALLSEQAIVKLNEKLNLLSFLACVEETYMGLINESKWQPQQARAVLPNSLKTEIVVTANLREWRTILKQRTSTAAHPQMRELMVPLLAELKTKVLIIFDDI